MARFRVEGAENLPDKGAGLVLFNHLAKSDVLFAPSAVPDRHTVVVGRRKFMEMFVIGAVFRRWGAVVVDVGKENPGREALSHAVDVMKSPLEDGRLELVFGSPNTRTPGYKPSRVNSGVLTAAVETETDIYPAVIKGTDRLFQDRLVVVKFAASAGHPDSLKERRAFGRHIQGIQTEMFDNIDHPHIYLAADKRPRGDEDED